MNTEKEPADPADPPTGIAAPSKTLPSRTCRDSGTEPMLAKRDTSNVTAAAARGT